MENILSFMTIVAYIIIPFIKVAYLLVPSLPVSLALDSIALSNSITDGMTLVSKAETFELGFFSPGNSKNRYLGIWYKNIPIQTVVWVANRLNPINDSSGILTLNTTGNLVLTQNDTVVWYTTSPRKSQNPVAQLLDSGNLVVQEEINEGNPEGFLWQSFDYPSDTLLPGMKFGWDLRTGLNRRLTAWKSPEDPYPGDFSFALVLNNYPEFCFKKGNKTFYRTGPWNGLQSSGVPDMKPNPVYNYNFIVNENEIYYTFGLKNNSVLSILVLNQTNYVRHRYVWSEATKYWRIYSTVPTDYCDSYGLCGANGNCIITDSSVCQCLKGFRPKSPQEWKTVDWSQGCVRSKPLSCEDKHKDGIIKLGGLKVPDTTHTWVDKTIGLEQCREKCLNNCSCMAYTNSDIRGQGSGCAMWFNNLVDIRQVSDGGQDLYIRLPASELEVEYGRKKKLTLIVATTIVAAILGIILVGSYCIHKVRRRLKEKKNVEADETNGDNEDDMDLPLLQFSSIVNATDNFSTMNKIGEGGFGPVYKGRLEHGQEIAVKKLSRSSRQGMTEFKNEIKLIAKLQHRNLVKLLGCCIHGQEKMLVYEYMPNSSLDSFIFDHTKGKLLDWSKRFCIICGIARGLLYLHQDSRLRIIHRDLKASNVLLDEKLNPKISDFGMAKIFGGDQTEGNTNKVVGTYGYMAPEYVADGLFSMKSDVFSFGILVLEIICGKKNRGFYHADCTHFIGHAWKLWKEGRADELVDSNMEDSCIISVVLRCIHVSLLCVQQYPEDRPEMPSVVLMLGSENALAEPKEPGFFPRKLSAEANSGSCQRETSSTNEITITLLDGR